MKTFKLIALIAALITLNLISLKAGDMKGENIKVSCSHGMEHTLGDYKENWIVLEWINFQCPFVKKHYETENMQKLQQNYTAKGIKWLSVCSSAPGRQGHFDNKMINKHLKKYNAKPTMYFVDESGDLGREYGAKTTPTIVVINPEGEIVYHGAIDDKPTTDENDVDGARNYLVEVLDAVLAGKQAPVSRTKAYGCSVKYDE